MKCRQVILILVNSNTVADGLPDAKGQCGMKCSTAAKRSPQQPELKLNRAANDESPNNYSPSGAGGISGKVNMVTYQPGYFDATQNAWITPADQYYHRYLYDAENRITDVYTGRDSVMLYLFPEREAHYYYYKHGPLARTELGQLRVQGLDYAYTLQGWLKAVNPVQGGALTNGTDTTQPFPVAQNAYGFSLHYYNGDYKAIGYTPQSTSVLGALGSNASALYNGNIAAMAVNIPKLGSASVYNYHYDQLNRLVAMDAYNGLNANTGAFTPVNINDYKERFSYNPDGGILTLLRNGSVSTIIDNASWNYYANSHRLEHIADPAGRYGWDAGNQAANNYRYDSIGQMTGDAERGLINDWTVYGKLKTQTISGTTISYTYDASGNRISKQLSTGYKEFYVRDASGNVISIYRSGDAAVNNGDLTQTELHLYGSSRLGANKPNTDVQNVVVNTTALSGGFGNAISSTFTRANKCFELSDHWGNNLVTLSDRRQQVSAAGATVDYYQPDIATAQDYSSFGSLLQGRQYGSTPRYTYNGKQLDAETGWQDYGMRNYIVDVPVFGSVDPLTKKYPYYSPYQFAGNSPIKFVDIDGLEPGINQPTTNKELKGKEGRMWAVNKAFNKTGGEDAYSTSPVTEATGAYTTTVDKTKFFANTDKSGLNRTVNENSQFVVTNEKAFKNDKELVNNMLGNWLWGIGPENYVFPENGKFSTELKSSIAVGETLVKWAKNNYQDKDYSWNMGLKGEVKVDLNSGFTSLEHFLGSVAVKISHVNEGTIKLEIFNVTSLTSGDINKDIFGSKALKSTMRAGTNKAQTDHSNISQYFSMTMSTSEADKLIKQFNGGELPAKK